MFEKKLSPRHRELRARIAAEVVALSEADTTGSIQPHIFKQGLGGACQTCSLIEKHPLHVTELPADAKAPLIPDADMPDPKLERSVDLSNPDYFEEGQTGVMIAFFLDPELAAQIAVPGGEKPRSLHVTLAYLGDAKILQDTERELLVDIVEKYASRHVPLVGTLNGLGVFTGGTSVVTYANADVPALPDFRQGLVSLLEEYGFTIARNHGYTPHITLAYTDKRTVDVPNAPLIFNDVTVCIGGARYTFALGAPVTPDGDGDEFDDSATSAVGLSSDDAVEAAKDSNAGGTLGQGQGKEKLKPGTEPHEYEQPAGMEYLQPGFYPNCGLCDEPLDAPIHIVNQTPVAKVESVKPRIEEKAFAPSPEGARAFVTEMNGHTLITGPAETTPWPGAEPAGNNPLMSWMAGRFVGAEEPNRNNAFWSAGDLQMGFPTVQFGPLNWLHDERHIIGCIAKATLVNYDAERDQEIAQPYISATSAIYKWIYPEEAAVVEMASDAGKLWYSMECISESVQCVGDNGCGSTASYMDYTRGAGPGVCVHMVLRTATRRFINPTFLGGAVIVPPTRPGWADADARAIPGVQAMAEKAFEQAGRPDIAASDFEQVVAQVVAYAGGTEIRDAA